MHGTIPPENIEKFEAKLVEGSVYKLTTFQVSRPKNNHNATASDRMIHIDELSQISQATDDISQYPAHYFEFASFDQIQTRDEQHPHLTGVETK